MKLYLIFPVLAVVGLVACSNETSAPATAAATAAAPVPAQGSEPAVETEGLSHLSDLPTAEEIQGRREAWVGGSSAAPVERVAAAPVPPSVRE